MTLLLKAFLTIILLGLLAEFVPAQVTDELKPSSNHVSGQKGHGFALSLFMSSKSARLGEAIWTTVELRNVAGIDNRFYSAGPWSFDFNVIDLATVKPVPHLRTGILAFISGPPSGRPFPANYSHFFALRLDQWVEVDHPGAYQVTVSAKVYLPYTFEELTLTSNSADIQVAPSSY